MIKVLCQIFWGPDLNACRQIKENTFFTAFESVTAPGKEAAADLLNALLKIADNFNTPKDLHDHLDECYIRLFINSKQGIIPLYQSCYEFEDAPMMGESARKMMDRFESSGIGLDTQMNEPPDHLAIELEFLFFLLQDASDAPEDQKKEAVQKAGRFAGQVMLPWVTQLHDRLEKKSGNCLFYLLTVRLLVILVETLFKADE